MLEPDSEAPSMPTVHVDLDQRAYDVVVEAGCLANAGKLIGNAGLERKRVAVISDATVAEFHADTLLESLNAAGYSCSLHQVPAGEASKSLAQVEGLCRELTREGHDRQSMVVALGGGVVGDLAGFVAAIFLRGIPFIQIPTTIVSQVDSSVGGKTGVNITEGKNLVGAFHQPKLVLVDPETLKTLGGREYREGFAEAIKHAAIRDASMLDDLAALDPARRDVPAALIARNIAIKARIVEEDEMETSGARALLNFGHTIGHGIEASVPYGELLHGEAIALGMRAALHLSVTRNGLEPGQAKRVLELLRHFQLPLTLPSKIESDTIMQRLTKDKKFDQGAVRFVLLEELGKAAVHDSITGTDLNEAIEHLRGESSLPN